MAAIVYPWTDGYADNWVYETIGYQRWPSTKDHEADQHRSDMHSAGIMKSSSLIILICLGALSACQTTPDVSAPIFKQGPSPKPSASVVAGPVTLSAEERQLIRKLAALYPAENAAIISRAFLEDPFMVGATTTIPRAQAIIDKIDAIRHIRTDSIRRVVEARKAAEPEPFTATVVLVSQLPDSSVAMVWRRTRAVPHDVIALRADSATVGTLGAGVRELMNLRRAEGDSATLDEHVAVHGEHIPAQWGGSMKAYAKGDLYMLRQSEVTSIPPFGMVHSRTIYLTATKRAPANP